MADRGTVAVDFDGVIHSYVSPISGITVVQDPPVDGALDFLRLLVDGGYRTVILSTRCREYPGHEGGIAAMKNWMQLHGLEDRYIDKLVFSAEKCAAILYIDDRAWLFTGKNFPTTREIDSFRTWTGKKSSTLPGGRNSYGE